MLHSTVKTQEPHRAKLSADHIWGQRIVVWKLCYRSNVLIAYRYHFLILPQMLEHDSTGPIDLDIKLLLL